MLPSYEIDFDPKEVAKIIAEALQDQSILSLSFIETTLFERLNFLLTKYMSQADVVWVISELKKEFLGGFTKLSINQFQNVVHNCIKCTEVTHPPARSSWNSVDPDLMIVAENPSSVKKYQDSLVTALKDAGFSSERCMLTYVTRCSSYEITSHIIKNCVPYLHTEVAIVNPKLILTLGLSSYAALCGDGSSKLNEIRGSIFWFGPYAILPETSLASGTYAQEKNQNSQSFLSGSLSTAYSFLYGGRS